MRRFLRATALSLAGALLAGGVAASVAPSVAVAAPAAGGPPTDTTVVIQSVGDDTENGRGGGGHQISGTELLFRASPPKGDESDQWWYLQTSPNSNGTYKVKSRTKDDRCMGRDSNAEGEARLAFRDCAGSGTDWVFEQVKGERYRIRPFGYQEFLQTPLDRSVSSDVTFPTAQATGERQLWYVSRAEPTRRALPADPTFDQVTYLTAHNAFNNPGDMGVMFPTQNQGIPVGAQLNMGVRALMLDTYQRNGRVRLCHPPGQNADLCPPTSQPLSEVFTTIADFLKAPGNEREIVTVFFEDYTSAADMTAEVGDDLGPGGQLDGLVFNPSATPWDVQSKGWPRISQLVAENDRLLLFSSSGDKTGLGIMHQKTWTAENYWSMGAPTGNSDWTCVTRWDDVPLSREEPKFRRLFVMNHFRDAAIGVTPGNDNEKILNRAQRFCTPAARRKPNFLAVDAVTAGNPMSAVETLNQYEDHSDTPGFGGTPDVQSENWHVPNLTVMPLGDSITEGAGSSTRSSYRAALWPQLVPRADLLDFVGSQKHGVLPDTDHEGHSGWLIEGLAANIDTWLEAAKPNVVLLHIGTNDMDRDHQVATAPARLASLVDQMIAASPQTTIVVATLVPSSSPAVQARIDAYNAQIPGIVAARQAQGHKVGLVSMGSLNVGDLRDRLHPNDGGYVKMAGVFAEGIAQVARGGWISPQVTVRPAPPRAGLGDYQVDLNADGRADYLTVDAAGAVRAWLNKGGDGRGGWTDAGQIASGVPLAGGQVRFADVSGDGYADYLVVDPNGAVRAWLNKGGTGVAGWTAAGQIASGVTLAGGQVRFADINGDRYADYVVVDPDGAVRAWLNKGGTGITGWTAAGQIASGVGVPSDQVRFADVNADGYADYLVVDAGGAVRAWLNKGGTGTAGWTSAGQIASGADAPGSSVRFADIDADRRADYLVVDAGGAVRAWLNKGGDGGGVGGGGWTAAGTLATGAGVPAAQVRFADVNADRRDDYLVVAADGSVRAWLNNGVAGSWTSLGQIIAAMGAPGDQVRFADLNADGRADYLTVAADGSLRAWLNNGVGAGWTSLGAYASGTGAPGDQVRLADIDADGRADYLTVAADGSVRAWLNQGGNGNGGWTAAGQIASGTGAAGSTVRFVDLNADGRADYLTLAADGSAKAWLNKDGAGNWTALGGYAPALGAPGAQVLFAEANGDGRTDYLTVGADGSVRAWINDGAAISGGWSTVGTIASGVGVPGSQVHI
ncbi:FG-GAP-like repeat-containing protein [Streptomyces sp. NBC_00572]|uniref:FG-GAP-like repeat-containing protein n=1 Tax=Streptomyces sp. NBC_00572 TaxID=2903664 RepID=UPI00224FBB8A|nr:FG-GAP-like repeat-containing protein [Streptomyces sp. NBC_00572]MCX4985131.1 FG-GAP-like repeat-containing protein [Streptomyces sp. NBC_00572]